MNFCDQPRTSDHSQPRKPAHTTRRRLMTGAAAILAGFTLCALGAEPTSSASAATLQNAPPANALLGTNLVPARPIPLITGTQSYKGGGSTIPVTVLPFTAGGEMSGPTHVPKSVLAPIPATVAKRMTAYLFPVNNWEWAYVIGPRGMTGKAEIATDGGAGFTLANADASIVFSHVGGSEFMAQGAAAQFFPAAGAALNRVGLGIKWTAKDLLHPATLSYRYNHRVALFSFASNSGRSVYGYAFYQPSYIGMFNMQAQFSFSADGADTSLAPYVMASALSNLTQVGASQLAGTVLSSPVTSIAAGNHVYRLPVPKGFPTQGMVLPTARGVAWIGQPTFIDTNTDAARGFTPANSSVPSGMFSINLGPAGEPTLGRGNFRTLTIIAPAQPGVWTNAPLYTSARLLETAGSNWLLYSVTYASLGMNQPAGNALYAISLQASQPVPRLLTSFLGAGGYFFTYGTYGPYVVYDKADDLNPQGKILQHIWLVNLGTGKRTRLPSTALRSGAVTANIEGRVVHVHMSQG